MKKCISVFIWVSFCVISYSQNWQKLDSLCYLYNDVKPDTAILLGKKAIEGCVQEKGKNSLEYVSCLDHIAWAYKSKAKYTVADSLYRQAKQICVLINKVESKEYAEVINNLGLVSKDQTRYYDAEVLLKEAREVRVKVLGKEHADYANSCNSLAILYQIQGRYTEAELFLKEAKEIYGKVLGKSHPDYATSCSNLATLYQKQGKYPYAEPLYKEAKDVYIRVLGKNHPSYAISCNNLALLYQIQGRFIEADTLYKEAKEIRARVVGKKHPSYAISCNNLAVMLKLQGKYAEAEILYKEAKDIFASVLGTKHSDYNQSCNNLAGLYQSQGRYTEAESLYKESKEIRGKVLGKEHPDYAQSCNNLAVLYQIQGRYSDAESLYKEAIKIRSIALGKEHPTYIVSIHNLAGLYYENGRYAEAEVLYIESITAKQKEIERSFANLSENEKEQYLKANVNDYFNDFQKFVSKYAVQKPEISVYGYQLSLATKGLILNSSEKIKNRILGSNNEELKKLYFEWKKTKDKYLKSLNLTIEQRKQKKINVDSLQNTTNEYEKKLALQSEDFANVFTPKHVTWQDIQNKLKKDEANIEIVKYQIAKDSVGYLAYIVKKKSKYPEVVLLPEAHLFDKLYIGYKREIRHKITDKYSYNAFWKPVLDKMKDVKHVYFCPDGVYHQINLNTLQNPETKNYVLDEIKITQVTNSKDILEPKKEVYKGIYLFGNPKYEIEKETPTENQRKVEYMDFPSGVSPLQGAENEVKDIDSLIKLKGSYASLYVQEYATEEAVKSLKNPYILHIATHGYFKRSKYQSAEQAMRNAGLLMAGVVDIDKLNVRPYNKEDGKLTALEIMNMELDSTELVVLSACETGLGEVSKEGVFGLQRAFKVAGASNIIMSLWKVDDFATQKLMHSFYYYWQNKSMDKKSAFLKAQSEVRKMYPEPYYWGAFVMIGE